MNTVPGTIRVSKNLKIYQKTRSGWQQISRTFDELTLVAKLYKAQKQLAMLVDNTNPRFLKGQVSPTGQVQGARISTLPTGEKLEKAFSLFSPHLRLHDQSSHDHWDVLYQNKGGTWSYVYTLKKRKQHRAAKYKKVELFEKNYAKLQQNVKKYLPHDLMALVLHTLLHTYMRVGNEVYFKAHGHKGLTTLMKKDVNIVANKVTFKYLGKDGVPILIQQKFGKTYIQTLNTLINTKKRNDFIFTHTAHPLHEHHFVKAFQQYCGHEFYPHIVRSHFATMQVKNFLHNKRSVNKESVQELYLAIAHALGHKKFDKKKQEWKDHYAVTVTSYIQPELIERIERIQR